MSGSVRGAGSVEERRLFSFTRSSICCSPAPTLFTDSCHYLRLIRFYPICRTTLFTETRTTRALSGGKCHGEARHRGVRFSVGRNECDDSVLLSNTMRMIKIVVSLKDKMTNSRTGTNTLLILC